MNDYNININLANDHVKIYDQEAYNALRGEGLKVKSTSVDEVDGVKVLTITTEKGYKITLTGPELEKCKDVQPGDFLHASVSVGKLQDTVKMDIFIMMALFHQIGDELKQSAREHRLAQKDIQIQELQNAADKMRSAAELAMWAGICSGITQVVSGISSMIGGIGGVVGGAKGTDGAMAVGKGWGEAWGGFGKLTEGGGQIGSSILNYYAEMERAQQKEHEANATKAEALSQQENEMMQEMSELIKKIRDMLQSIEQSNMDTMKNILRV